MPQEKKKRNLVQWYHVLVFFFRKGQLAVVSCFCHSLTEAGHLIPRPTENSLDWSLARSTCNISDLQSGVSSGRATLMDVGRWVVRKTLKTGNEGRAQLESMATDIQHPISSKIGHITHE